MIFKKRIQQVFKYGIPKKGIYLYFAEKYVALLLLSLKKNMQHNKTFINLHRQLIFPLCCLYLVSHTKFLKY